MTSEKADIISAKFDGSNCTGGSISNSLSKAKASGSILMEQRSNLKNQTLKDSNNGKWIML